MPIINFKPKGIEKYKFKFVLCHQQHERSFHYKNRQFPLCARCTGILTGYLALPFFIMNYIKPTILLIILLSLPLLIDSTTQTMKMRESNNKLRFITGFLFGIAQAALVVLTAIIIVSFLT